jgi:hypothetical protein
MPVNHQHQNPTPPIRWIRPALGPETEGAGAPNRLVVRDT